MGGISELDDALNALEMCRAHRDRLMSELLQHQIGEGVARANLIEAEAVVRRLRRENAALRERLQANA